MRGSKPGGRFNIEFEHDHIQVGIREDLQKTIGTTVRWWTFDEITSTRDPIYDVGDNTLGRRWKDPFYLPVIWAHIIQSEVQQNAQGFYQSDTMRLTVSIDELKKQIPDIIGHPDHHLLDRVVYRSSVFTPTRIYFRGLTHNDYSVLTIDLTQVNPEELVNDSQFNSDTWLLEEGAGQYPVFPVEDVDGFLIVYDTEGATTYVGEAATGSATTDLVWRIRAVTADTTGVLQTYWPVGDRSYSYAWNDRLGLQFAPDDITQDGVDSSGHTLPPSLLAEEALPVFIGPNQPGGTGYVWIQTNPDGSVKTIWTG